MDKFFELHDLKFEWDEEKYAANIFKHNVKFEEAAEVFFDNEHQVGDATVDEEFHNISSALVFSLICFIPSMLNVVNESE